MLTPTFDQTMLEPYFWTLVDGVNDALHLLDCPADDLHERPATGLLLFVIIYCFSLSDYGNAIRLVFNNQREVIISWTADEQPLAEKIVQMFTKLMR
jgi:hypothetical protein